MFRSALLACLLIAITKLAVLSRRDLIVCAQGARTSRAPVLGCLYRSRLCRSVPAMSTLTAGLVGPSYELSVGAADSGRLTLHPLFAALVLGMVISRFFWYLDIPSAMRCSDMRQLSRSVSRGVYLVLYGEILLREIAGLFHAAYRDGPFDGPSLYAYFKMPADQVTSEFTYEFRGYLVCSLIAILAIRTLTAVYGRSHDSRA